MKYLSALLLVITLGITSISQAQMRGQRMNNIPQGEPTEKEIEKRKRQIAERREELIDTFISTLEADDFQKQIIKQYMNSYVDEKMSLIQTKFSRLEERERAYKNLEDTHFKDLEGLISENDMEAIKSFINGDFDEKKAKKERKKKKKKKN